MLEIGKSYLFHTHLGIWLGRVTVISPMEVVLDQCSWVVEQGFMGACVREGTIQESQFVGDGVIVPRNAIKVPWRHALPKEDR